jgi:hypothetical protein
MNNADAIVTVVKETVVEHLRPGWTNVPVPTTFTLPAANSCRCGNSLG